jgi:hypothetical protein
MNDDIALLGSGDFKVVPQGSKDSLSFKQGDTVRFCDETWQERTTIGSESGNWDITIAGQGPHIVASAKYNETGHPVVVLKGYEHFKPFNQEMFVACD